MSFYVILCRLGAKISLRDSAKYNFHSCSLGNGLNSTPPILIDISCRIALKKDNQHFTLATATRQDTIERHWKYLVDELIPQAMEVQHDQEARDFIQNRGTNSDPASIKDVWLSLKIAVSSLGRLFGA
jgi:hypothetical protein